ncbi:MAG TPA: ABC transporter substrate-binding protein [Anaerolineaceae bacterium]|nr:ABC transporter substrate-binding protein [Anaerolineaceae bacterium]
MRQRTHLSGREKKILTLYILAFMGTMLLCGIFGLLGINLSPRFTLTNTVEIAVIMPSQGDNAGIGAASQQAVASVVANYQDQLAGPDWSVNVRFYDAGETLNSAAWAAWRALSHMNTIAIIGPYDSRQALAVAEVVEKFNIPVISPAASSPALADGAPRNLIPMAPAVVQEHALLAEVLRQERRKIFEIGVGLPYVQNQMDTFNRAMTGSAVELVGVAQIDVTAAGEIAAQIQSTEADAVVYFGDAQQLQRVLEEMVSAGLNLPVYLLDTVDPATVLVYNRTGIDIYHTSLYLDPSLQIPQPDIYLLAAATAGGAPLSYESSLAAGLTLNALAEITPQYITRRNFLRAMLQISPNYLSQHYHSVYIYHLPADQTAWVLLPTYR